MNAPQRQSEADLFIVCGLGRLGQHCSRLLKEFGVTVIGLDQLPHPPFAHAEPPDTLDRYVVGDCCDADSLRRAGIGRCRAVLLLTGDARTNVAAAFAARSLNPDVRIVMRSAQDNLNRLLAEQMGNLAAFEPSRLSADAFARACLGEATQGLFQIGDTRLRVVRLEIEADHPWCGGRRLADLSTAAHRVIGHSRGLGDAAEGFHGWDPDADLRPGDTLTMVERADQMIDPAGQKGTGFVRRRRPEPRQMSFAGLGKAFGRFWRAGTQMRRVALISLLVLLTFLAIAVMLFEAEYPDVALFDAINVSVVLALGGFDNVFGSLHLPFAIPTWLYLFSVVLTITGTIFLGILYAMMTERVLSARLQIARRRPPVPEAGHTIVVGLGPTGRRVARVLRDVRRPMVGLAEQAADADPLPDLPVLVGPVRETLLRANVEGARSVVVLTDDDVINLEIGLTARAANPAASLVLRTDDQDFARNVASLVPAAIVMDDRALAAEAIAGAAFGENILSAFHLDGRAVLVTEYRITAGDTLVDRVLGELACGYDVVPVGHGRVDSGAPVGSSPDLHAMPAEDIRLQEGDWLVVLATIEGLKRIEVSEVTPARWALQIESAPSSDACFAAANTIARFTGCDIARAREALDRLPAMLDLPLHRHSGLRLVRELRKLLVQTRLVPATERVHQGMAP